jgi:hypothetical protein
MQRNGLDFQTQAIGMPSEHEARAGGQPYARRQTFEIYNGMEFLNNNEGPVEDAVGCCDVVIEALKKTSRQDSCCPELLVLSQGREKRKKAEKHIYHSGPHFRFAEHWGAAQNPLSISYPKRCSCSSKKYLSWWE